MTITKEAFDEVFSPIAVELTKEEADQLLDKLGNLYWWEQEESSQFTGIETFYGFNTESKEAFLKDGNAESNYFFKMDIDVPNEAFIRECGGQKVNVKFDGEDDFKEFHEKVLWNRTFHFEKIELVPDDKVRVFKVIDDENGFEVREQEIADEGVRLLVKALSEMKWLKESLPTCEHRYFGFTQSGYENVLEDHLIPEHHSYYFTLKENGFEGILKDFLEDEYILRFGTGIALKKFWDKVITPNLFNLWDKVTKEDDKPTMVEKEKPEVNETPVVSELGRIADELKRQNDIHEVEVMLKVAKEVGNAIGQTYDTTPEMLHRRYEIRDKLMDAACKKMANLSSIVLEPFKEG